MLCHTLVTACSIQCWFFAPFNFRDTPVQYLLSITTSGSSESFLSILFPSCPPRSHFLPDTLFVNWQHKIYICPITSFDLLYSLSSRASCQSTRLFPVWSLANWVSTCSARCKRVAQIGLLWWTASHASHYPISILFASYFNPPRQALTPGNADNSDICFDEKAAHFQCSFSHLTTSPVFNYPPASCSDFTSFRLNYLAPFSTDEVRKLKHCLANVFDCYPQHLSGVRPITIRLNLGEVR